MTCDVFQCTPAKPTFAHLLGADRQAYIYVHVHLCIMCIRILPCVLHWTAPQGANGQQQGAGLSGPVTPSNIHDIMDLLSGHLARDTIAPDLQVGICQICQA